MILRFKRDSLEDVTKLLVATTMGRKKADLVIKDGPLAGILIARIGLRKG